MITTSSDSQATQSNAMESKDFSSEYTSEQHQLEKEDKTDDEEKIVAVTVFN